MERTPSRSAGGVAVALLLLLVSSVAVVPAAAQCADGNETCQEQQLESQFDAIGNFIILLIGLVAVPNGAYGLFEWMTAGADTEKDRKGRKRIRNTFIALAGAAIIKVAVELFKGFVSLG